MAAKKKSLLESVQTIKRMTRRLSDPSKAKGLSYSADMARKNLKKKKK